MGPRPVEDDVVGAGEAPTSQPGRRRFGWLVVVVVVGVVLAVVRPELSLSGDPLDRSEPPDRVALDDPVPITDDSLTTVTWEQRGDLTRDSAYVAVSVRRIRQESHGVSRILFAGSLPDGTRVSLSGSDADEGVATVVHAMVVPPGVDPLRAGVTEVTALTNPQDVLAWAGRASDGHVYAVVLARPGPVDFEYSASLRYRDDGTPTRRWTSVSSGDGTAVVDLGPAGSLEPVVAVRARGPAVYPLVTLAPTGPDRPEGAVQVAGLDDPAYAGPEPALLTSGLRDGLSGLVDLPSAAPRVLWSGAPWKGRRLALVLVTRPDGVRLRALVGQDGDQVFPAGVRALPAGETEQAPWLLEPFTTQDPTFLLCPAGAAVEVQRPGGREVRLTVPTGGALAVYEPTTSPPSLRGARVLVLDEQGQQVVRTTLPEGSLADPLALDRD